MTASEHDEAVRTLQREMREVKQLLSDPDQGLAPRVRGMELWKARMEGIQFANRWIIPLMVAVISSVITGAIILATSNPHG